MDGRFKRRILAFNIAGFLNLALGLYVLFNGRGLVAPGMWYILLVFFFSFAVVDFWFARFLKKKWIEAYQQHLARQQAAQDPDEGGTMKDVGEAASGGKT